jgi:acyl carrier protein
MKNREEIRSEFIALLAPFVNLRSDQPITESASLVDDLNLNSARFVDIILEAEERFNISIDDAAADRMRTVGDAIDVIVDKSGGPVRSQTALFS